MTDDGDGPLITIMTATWNRVHLLPRLWESIRTQQAPGCRFEWLVIDDGSTDGTADWLAARAAEAPDLVRFVVQPNGGKCSALNRGGPLARGKWCLIVDSDDFLAFNGIALAAQLVKEVSDERIGLLFGLRQINGGTSHRFAHPTRYRRFTDWVNEQTIFDTAPFTRTDLFCRFPYPLAEGEKHMAEGWQQFAVGKRYDALFRNSVIVQAEYLPDGLSSQALQLRAKYPRNAMTVYLAMLDSSLNLRMKVRAAINYWRFHFHARRQSKGRVLPQFRWFPFLPAGWVLHLRDLRQIGALDR